MTFPRKRQVKTRGAIAFDGPQRGKEQRSNWYAKNEEQGQSSLRQRIRNIALSRLRFGYLRVLVILKREGWPVGKTRGYRLYWLEARQLRMKVKRRKRISLLRGKPQKPTGPNQH